MNVMNVKHYGKKLDDLSKDEQKLLMMDTVILLGNVISKKSPILMLVSDFNGQMNDIIQQRLELTLKLLNLDITDFETEEEIVDYIENSRYSIEKFKQDVKVNTENIQRIERMSVLN